MRYSGSFALAAALMFGLASSGIAQIPPGGGNIPSKEEIEKRIEEEFAKLPDETAEIEGARLLYKAIPTDPVEVIKASGQLPAGANPDAVAKQFLPMARPYVEKYLGAIGKLELKKEVTLKSGKLKAKLAPATYDFGLVMEELVPIAIRISGGELKAPLTVPLRTEQVAEHAATLKIELRPSKVKGEFAIEVRFAKVHGLASKFTSKK